MKRFHPDARFVRIDNSQELDDAFAALWWIEEFRSSLQQLDRLSKGFVKHAGEVIQEMRAVPKIKSDLTRFPAFALVFTALVALVAGILVGKFIL